MTTGTFHWLTDMPFWPLGGILLTCVLLAAGAGFAVKRLLKRNVRAGLTEDPNQESAILSGFLGLFALLLAFTFSLTIDRFEVRRQLVITNSNAIGTAYLRVQLLPEPHRTRLSGLLVEHTRNVLALARAPKRDVPALISRDDRLLEDLWSATTAAHDAVRTVPLSSNLIESINTVINQDAARRGERTAHIPVRVFAALLLYLLIMSAVFGYLLSGKRTRMAAFFLLMLLVGALLLIIDIDQPTKGQIVESQAPMEAVLESLQSHPPAYYDRLRDHP